MLSRLMEKFNKIFLKFKIWVIRWCKKGMEYYQQRGMWIEQRGCKLLPRTSPMRLNEATNWKIWLFFFGKTMIILFQKKNRLFWSLFVFVVSLLLTFISHSYIPTKGFNFRSWIISLWFKYNNIRYIHNILKTMCVRN